MQSKKHIKNNSDRTFDIVNNSFLVLCLILVALPLLNIISQSISAPANVLAGKILFLPKDFSLIGYIEIFKEGSIIKAFANSFIITFLGTLVGVFFTISAAYPLARKTFVGKKIFVWVFTFTMIFNGGLIPTYLIVRDLHLINSIWAVILVPAVSAYNIIIAKSFFQNTIPDDIYEASELDGCTDIRLFVSIVVPLSKPIIAVMVLFHAIYLWNSYFEALIYLSTPNKFPLQLLLRNILIVSKLQTFMNASSGRDQSEVYALTESMKYCIIVVSSLPVMLLYPFIQKYFVKGIMIGSIKG